MVTVEQRAISWPSVFLSYARGDDEPFVARLDSALASAGCAVWWDRQSMPSRALGFIQEIRDAIDGADRLVFVVGSAALRSAYVEAEWRYALEAGKVVIPVLRLLEEGRRIEDLLPWQLRRLHVVDGQAGREEGRVFEEVLRHLQEPVPLLGATFFVPDPPPHYQPRPTEMRRLDEAVYLDQPGQVTAAPRERVVTLHGMAGLGKSVLAASFAGAIDTRRLFSAGVVWVDLGRDADVLNGLRRVGRVLADDLRAYSTVGAATERAKQGIGQSPFLVVADNAWNSADVEPFRAILGPRARLLVTTRDAGLATELGTWSIGMDLLDEDEALRHLADWIGTGPASLPAAARGVAAACGRLPLAIALVGAMARDGTGWQDLYEALSEADLEFVSSRLPDYPYTDLLRALQVSFEALQDSDDATQREAAVRYLELAAFQWDVGVPESAVVTVWTGRAGLTERRARKVLTLLASKALVRTDGSSPNRRVQLHDLLQDFIRASAGDLRAEHATLLAAYRSRHPEAPFIPDDGYYLGHYAYHLTGAGQADALHHLLQRETDKGINAWWQHRLAHGQMAGFVDDVTRAWHDARARWTVAGEDCAAASLLVRYSLMQGSVRSAVGEVPAELANLLVEFGVWPVEQALAVADWAAAPGRRFDVVVALLTHVDAARREALINEAAATARREPEAQDRARRLLDLAGAVSPERSRAYIDEAVGLVDEVLPSMQCYVLTRAWELLPARLELLDLAIQTAGSLDNEWSAVSDLRRLAKVVPADRLPAIRQRALRIADPEQRFDALLALLVRADCPDSASLAETARAALAAVPDPADPSDPSRLALLARFLADGEAVDAAREAVTRVENAGGRRSLAAVLDVLPLLKEAEQARAERLALDLAAAMPLRDVAGQLSGHDRAARLHEADPLFLTVLADAALARLPQEKDVWARASALPILLRLLDRDRATTIGAAEADRVLLVDDLRDRAVTLATFAERMEEERRSVSVSPMIARLLTRSAVGDDLYWVPSLVSLADSGDLTSIQAALDDTRKLGGNAAQAAIAAAWARLGRWDQAQDAMHGLPAFYVRDAVEGFPAPVPKPVAWEIIQNGLAIGDAELYAAVVAPLAASLAGEQKQIALAYAFQAADALERPYDVRELLAGIIPLLPCDQLSEALERFPEEQPGLDRDKLLLPEAYSPARNVTGNLLQGGALHRDGPPPVGLSYHT